MRHSPAPRALRALWFSLAGVALSSATARAQCEVQERQLLVAPPAGGEGQLFGHSTGISGDLALVGATHDQETQAGEVYAYRRIAGQWLKQQRLLSSDSRPGDEFGCAIAMDGNVALIGATGQTSTEPNGAAYVFRFDGSSWVEEQKLVAPDGAADDLFGASVALSGGIAVIGAPYDDEKGLMSGSAYVFRFDGQSWNQDAKLIASNGKSNDGFGTGVATDGSQIMAGSPHNARGSVHVFAYDGSGWTEGPTLVPSDATDQFGLSVAMSGSVALIGAPIDHAVDGAAYVFRFDGTAWNQEQKLQGDAGSGGQFGWSVSLLQDVALVGSPRWQTRIGTAYVYGFDGTSWQLVQRLLNDGGVPNDVFGYALAQSADTLLVTKPRVDDVGEVVAYDLESDSWTETAQLQAHDENELDRFGSTLATSGRLLVVGAPGDQGAQSDEGSVSIYRRTGADWGVPERVLASDHHPDDRFGSAVSVDGSVIVVGAEGEDDTGFITKDKGAVYVLRDTGGATIEEAKVVASDRAEHARLGAAVDVSGDRLVAGAPGANTSGTIYVFENDGVQWSERARLLPGDGLPAEFGEAVAIDGDVVVAGAPLADGTAQDSGAAYVYRRVAGTWTLEQKLLPSDAIVGLQFGGAVDVRGDAIVIGSALDDDRGPASGSVSVYRFKGSQWLLDQKLVAADGAAFDLFGKSVSLTDTHLAVGAHRADAPAHNSGRIYLYRRSPGAWYEVMRGRASDAGTGDEMGSAVALSDEALAAGSPFDDELGTDSGSVLVFPIARSLTLDATPEQVSAGEHLALTTFYGTAGGGMLLVAVAVSGAPIFVPIVHGAFGADGTHVLTATVLPGLSGLSVTLRSFGLDVCSIVAQSNLATVVFE